MLWLPLILWHGDPLLLRFYWRVTHSFAGLNPAPAVWTGWCEDIWHWVCAEGPWSFTCGPPAALPGDEIVMQSSLPLKNGLAYTALMGALPSSDGGQDLMEKFEALYPIGRWDPQVKKGTKEQDLFFSFLPEKTHQVSNLHTNSGQAAVCATTMYCEPDHNIQTHEKGRKQKLLPWLCWCAVMCWLFQQALTYLPDRAIQSSQDMHCKGQDQPHHPLTFLPSHTGSNME